MQNTIAQVYVFCTYKNKETKGTWRKSRMYSNMDQLLQAMGPYLEKNRWTSVQYQTETKYVSVDAQ